MSVTIGTEMVALALFGLVVVIFRAMTSANDAGKGKDVSGESKTNWIVFIAIAVILYFGGQTFTVDQDILTSQPDQPQAEYRTGDF